jgi:hypothetical protein
MLFAVRDNYATFKFSSFHFVWKGFQDATSILSDIVASFASKSSDLGFGANTAPVSFP